MNNEIGIFIRKHFTDNYFILFSDIIKVKKESQFNKSLTVIEYKQNEQIESIKLNDEHNSIYHDILEKLSNHFVRIKTIEH